MRVHHGNVKYMLSRSELLTEIRAERMLSHLDAVGKFKILNHHRDYTHLSELIGFKRNNDNEIIKYIYKSWFCIDVRVDNVRCIQCGIIHDKPIELGPDVPRIADLNILLPNPKGKELLASPLCFDCSRKYWKYALKKDLKHWSRDVLILYLMDHVKKELKKIH